MFMIPFLFSSSTVSFSVSLMSWTSKLQTVACFPFFGGVVEMGVTELVISYFNFEVLEAVQISGAV